MNKKIRFFLLIMNNLEIFLLFYCFEGRKSRAKTFNKKKKNSLKVIPRLN